ncbi:MAG: ABC transporter ATP-binding protein [Trueperaceae bacterium]
MDPSALDADAPLLEITDLSVTLGGERIVTDVHAVLRAGERLVLTGRNGAGKSTLLRALVGLLPHDGRVRIAGRPQNRIEARAAFAFVPDEPELYDDLTLREHVRFTVMLYRRPEDEERILAWLDAFRLADRLDESPGTHSRGMRQKTALAIALGLRTPLLLLDEPFAALDLEAQEQLASGLIERADEGSAVLLTGHQPGLVASLRARELRLEDGTTREVAPQDATAEDRPGDRSGPA